MRVLAVICFEQLVSNLRLDSREDRNTGDNFALFRRTCEQFIENCRKCYVVSRCVARNLHWGAVLEAGNNIKRS